MVRINFEKRIYAKVPPLHLQKSVLYRVISTEDRLSIDQYTLLVQ